ncbi:Pyridine nucleotide-disulphide oxidoreductase, dimerisation domain [Primorskyibacter flagellatus]|uniref:Pyridine nucleotide-disulphide oxidoreductase, dimerisation domain n=1 Tax=Primorskyibacter flagellatus TaxID=1387277 RepID=A0A1W2DVS7_9RHOB|nr:Pyridine nucleotide-disulphide oxidoreductase, dimerisation domain [Primorskyibacter flagellatus]
MASVALTEAQARAAGDEVKTWVLPIDSVPRAIAGCDTRGPIELMIDADADRLLGGAITARERSDSVQTFAMARKLGMTTKALGQTICPCLTLVEA